MQKLILFIKTYKPDFLRVLRLLRSIEKFNTDRIPVYIAVNDSDYTFFKNNLEGHYTLMRDSDIVTSKMKDGWRYSAIIKPQLYKTNICENYLVIDSDAEFIRPFSYLDFMYDDSTPYTIMHENKDFLELVESLHIDSEKVFHIAALRAVRKKLGTHGKLWDYGPNPHLWSTKVWRHFHEVYLQSLKHNFESYYREMEKDALPHEAAMYGEYLLKTRLIDIIPVEGFFKVYHYQEQFEKEKKYFSLEKLKKNYLGIIFQGNWNENINLLDTLT